MFKRKVVAAFFKYTDGWNTEIHENIESRVFTANRQMFPSGGGDDTEARIQKMREFYYMRMSNTANLLVGMGALFVALVSLVIALIALFKQ